MAIKLDDRYQIEAYEKISKSLYDTKKAGIIMPTGTGKSYIALKLIEDNLKDANQILYVAPSFSIKTRIHKLIKENYSEEQAKEILNKIKIVTYHGLQRRFKTHKEDMREYNSDLIILDEIHRSGAEEWGKAVDYLLENNQKANVLGMTATPLRTDGQNMIEKRCGDVTYELPISEAVARGILKLPVYISARHISEDEVTSLEEQLELVDDEKTRKELEEKLRKVKKQVENGKGLKDIYEKYLEHDGKYITFCNPGDDIEELQEQAKRDGVFDGVNENQEYLIVESSRTEQENQIALDNFGRKKAGTLKLLYAKNMLNEGYHDEEITGEIMARPTKSYVLYVQQLGRILSRDRQTSPVVLDLVGNIRYFKDFRLEVQEIIKQGISRGETVYDEKVLESFRILEEQEEFVQAFEEIEERLKSYFNRCFDVEHAIQEIAEWCKENYEDKPLYKRKMPTRIPGISTRKNDTNQSKAEKQSRLSVLNDRIKNSDLYIKYIDGELDELNQEEIKLMENYEKIRSEYDYRYLNNMAENIEKIEQWCKEKFDKKTKYLRRMPSNKEGVLIAKEEKEKRLAGNRRIIEQSSVYKKFTMDKNTLNKGEIQLMERYFELLKQYDYKYLNIMAQNIIEIEEWCEEKNQGKKRENFTIPHRSGKYMAAEDRKKETERQKENRLSVFITKLKNKDIYEKYIEGRKEELNDVEIELMDRYFDVIQKYDVNQLELKIDEIEQWCKEKFEGMPRYMRRFPKRDDTIKMADNKEIETEEQRENRLGKIIHKIDQGKLKKYYQGNTTDLDKRDIEQIERFIELKKEYDVSGLEIRIDKIEEWCEEKFKDMPLFMRRMPRICIKSVYKTAKLSDFDKNDERYKEIKLGQDRARINIKYKEYKEGNIEKLTQEEITLLKRYEEILKEYDNEPLNAIGRSVIEIEEWCKEEKRIPRIIDKIKGQRIFAAKEDENETFEQKERRLGYFKYRIYDQEFYQNYLDGNLEKMSKAEIELAERYVALENKYGKKIKEQDIGKATFDVSVEECDKADEVLGKLLKQTKEKGEKS